jgi:hypothetical protein
MSSIVEILTEEQLIHPHEGYRHYVEQLISDVDNDAFDFNAELQEIKSPDMQVKLLPEPEMAVDDFNILYARAQACRSRVSAIMGDVLLIKSKWISRLSTATWLYDVGQNHIYTTDQEPYSHIRSAKNLAIQSAYIAECMPHLYDLCSSLKRFTQSIDVIYSVFKEKRDDMDEILTNLSRQQRNVETMIGLGGNVATRAINK